MQDLSVIEKLTMGAKERQDKISYYENKIKEIQIELDNLMVSLIEEVSK